MWSVVNGMKMTDAPCLSNNLDWLLRLSEYNTLIQKYQRRPLLVDGHKTIFRFNIVLKSVVPLEAYVCNDVAVMTAPHKFTLADNKHGDENTHTCSVQSDKLFSDLPKSDHIFDKAVDQIRTVLRAYQV